VAIGAWTWAGTAAGRLGPAAIVGVVALALVGRGRWRVVAVVLIAAVAGTASLARETSTLQAALPLQAPAIVGVANSDTMTGGFAMTPSHIEVGSELVDWEGPRLWVRSDIGVEVGQRVVVRGRVAAGGFRTRYGPVAGSVAASRVTVVGGPNAWLQAGSILRQRVRSVFADRGPGPALVTGFLIGDTSLVPESDLESLRHSGLSHFVAVSGSNVALVVGGWWILAGLFLVDGRWRAATSLIVVVIFAIATRWEPSVVRASVMAALVLGGRIIGRPISAWWALGVAVTVIVVAAPELVGSVGFQLSVAATAGVIATAGMARGWLGVTAAATAGAQLAVAPLLLVHFGAVPLLAPAANVVAAPLVTAATATGAIAAITGIGVAASLAGLLADAVTLTARAFAAGPQLDGTALVGVLGVVSLVISRRWRPLGATVGAAVLILSAAGPTTPAHPQAVFLDVGQGDGVLLHGGATVLIDGGPDPALLRQALARYGVRRIDLAILSHPHADHYAGLVAALEGVPVSLLWYPAHSTDPALLDVLALAERRGIPAVAPAPGSTAALGPFLLEVLGPQRRYASINDGSLVVAVSAGGPRLLAAGDIETIAQRELDPGRVDILKVPHQGAATSDLDWLREHAGSVAVISVGPNTFGHPSADAIAALASGGATVLRTDSAGDITISLAPGSVGE
jgi:competence protein ComEC